MVAPSSQLNDTLRSLQVPWSLNSAALRFLELVVDDVEFMEKTWKFTTEWRQREVDEIAKLFPKWKCCGEPWLSWIWIETTSAEEAAEVVEVSRTAGVPIRHGKHGYNSPHCIRIAVREPKYQDVLFQAWKALSDKAKEADEGNNDE